MYIRYDLNGIKFFRGLQTFFAAVINGKVESNGKLTIFSKLSFSKSYQNSILLFLA